MSKEYIPISKKYFKRVARESVDIAVKIHEIKSSLKAIQSIINLTDVPAINPYNSGKTLI